jgi:hypothetical protein
VLKNLQHEHLEHENKYQQLQEMFLILLLKTLLDLLLQVVQKCYELRILHKNGDNEQRHSENEQKEFERILLWHE